MEFEIGPHQSWRTEKITRSLTETLKNKEKNHTYPGLNYHSLNNLACVQTSPIFFLCRNRDICIMQFLIAFQKERNCRERISFWLLNCPWLSIFLLLWFMIGKKKKIKKTAHVSWHVVIMSMVNGTHKLLCVNWDDIQSELLANNTYCQATNHSVFPRLWENCNIREHD